MPVPKGNVPWNAGTSAGWTDKRGYRWLYVSENGRRRARREHRVIVERHIGRRLEPWEVVHHKDGNPSNNQISNLEVVEFGAHTAEHHTGSRRSADARRSIEAFALMREELKAERALKAELLEACQTFAEWLRREEAGFPAEIRFNTPEGEAKWREWFDENLRICDLAQKQARAAISKATGGEA